MALELPGLSDFVDVSALYVMSDLRGFSAWSRRNQPEVRKLTRMLYSLALEVFGRRSEERHNRRVVKFLGDGFFAVHEYRDEDGPDFAARLGRTLTDIRAFMAAFSAALANSNLHDRADIRVSFGMSYGNSFRFHLVGQPLDYIGEKVNLSARLCGIANPVELVVEHDLVDHMRRLPPGVVDGLRFEEDRVAVKSYGTVTLCRVTDTGVRGPAAEELQRVAPLLDALRTRQE